MQSDAAVIFGRNQVKVATVELPDIGPEEILMRVVSSSMCLSTSKALALGEDHKRVPDNIAQVPVITGHEFAGVIERVGASLTDQFTPGQNVAIQPAMGLDNGYSPGYSYPYYGGDATFCIIPKIAIDKGCVLPYAGNYYANASLAEPMSCIIGAFRASYHTRPYVYEHDMGIRRGGRLAVLGCGGPMGIGAIDYALHGPFSPRQIVAVDSNEARLQRLRSLFPPQDAAARGVELVYLNASDLDAPAALGDLSTGEGYDDVIVFAASTELLQLGDSILATDGCLNFFAGPTDKSFAVPMNFYNVHYERTHLVGTSGGSREDMAECLELASKGLLNPSLMVTHIAGLGAIPDALSALPSFVGGKILAYPHVEMDLTGIEDFPRRAETDPRFAKLTEICERHANIWNQEAETYLLDTFARN